MGQGPVKGAQRAAQAAAGAVAWDQLVTEPVTGRASNGAEISLAAVQSRLEGELVCLDIWLGEHVPGQPPHVILANPPTLVEDPAGDVEMGGKTWREDPLAAVVEALSGSIAPVRKVR